MYPPIKMLVAHANDNVIGFNNSIPWYLPEDLKRFKALTSGNIIVMGRKTYESLPHKPLPDRMNIVLTEDPTYQVASGVAAFHDLPTLLELFRALFRMKDSRTIFIVGGESIYKAFLSICDEVLVTDIHLEVKGDRFFPVLSDRIWTVVSKESNYGTKPSQEASKSPQKPLKRVPGISTLKYDYITYKRF